MPSSCHGGPSSAVRSRGQGWRVAPPEGLVLDDCEHGGTRGGSMGRRALEFRSHAGEHFEPEVFLIAQAVGAPLNHPDLGVEALDEAQADLVLRPAVSRNAVPMPIDHLGKLLVRLQALPLEAGLPILEELPRPTLARL